ncbi:hypothetical protein PBI_CAMILLE_36 [Microbacterium phage Camille]|nr:hypothetical protein PBI_CAMILLE_36 [Microbacterium phage Camille]
MSLEEVTKNVTNTVKENSPSILAGLAVGGVVTTGLLAFKFGHDYGYEEAMLEEVQSVRLTGKEKFERYWRPLIPTILVGATTVTCIIASTAISNRRNAALAGLVTLGEVTLREYKDKVAEVVTKPKREEIDKGLAQDKLDKVNDKEIVWMTDGEDILLFDTLTSRVFKSNQMSIQQAEIEMNRRILNDDYISQNEWYDAIGLSRTSMGDDFGWNHDNPLEVKFIPLLKDGKPVMGIDYRFPPVSTFDRFS